MDPLTIAALGGAAVQGVSSIIANRRLKKAQEDAAKAQVAAQDQFLTGFDAYQRDVNRRLEDVPQRRIDDTLVNQALGKAQGDFLATQGRAAGVESLLDATRQSTADQALRASQVARTPMDLLGAIGQISARESSMLNRIEGQAARDRQRRMDAANENLIQAIENKSVFRTSADNLLFQDRLNNFQQQLAFNQQADLSRLNTQLGFAQTNIAQQAAIGSQQAAGIQGFGAAIGSLSGPLMTAGTANQQMANDLAIAQYS